MFIVRLFNNKWLIPSLAIPSVCHVVGKSSLAFAYLYSIRPWLSFLVTLYSTIAVVLVVSIETISIVESIAASLRIKSW